jgi:hypothetical protein
VALSFKFYRITYSPPPLGALTSHYTQPHPCPLATLGGVGDEEVREEAATMARWRLVGEARSRGRVVVGGWRGGAQVEGEAVWGGGWGSAAPSIHDKKLRDLPSVAEAEPCTTNLWTPTLRS